MTANDRADEDFAYHLTAEDRRWRLYRFAYYATQWIFVLIVGFQVGPNLLLFGSIFSPTPAELSELTVNYNPMIAAIKAYQRDYQKLPVISDELPKEYQPIGFNETLGEIMNTTSITFPTDMPACWSTNFLPRMRVGLFIHRGTTVACRFRSFWQGRALRRRHPKPRRPLQNERRHTHVLPPLLRQPQTGRQHALPAVRPKLRCE